MESEQQRPAAPPTLVFAYNADSGLFNALADAAHKLISPRTYPCRLCALTHTATGMRADWRRFLDGLGRPLEFLHADELRARHGAAPAALPAVFEREGGALKVLLGAEAINACRSLDDLKRLLLEALGAGDPAPAPRGTIAP